MPATLFAPLHSVIAHSLVPLDDTTLHVLQPESYLLVHRAPAAATNSYIEETDINGDLVYACYYNFKIRWSVTADALALTGLANYHPGAELSTQSLQFLNAARHPFQIPGQNTTPRRLIYENPVQDPIAGDMVAVTFDVVSMFGGSTGPTKVLPDAPDTSTGLVPEIGSGTHWSDIYGVSLIWIRRVGVLTGPDTGNLYGNIESYETLPAATTPPADLAAFLAAPISGSTGTNNTLPEVFNALTDTYYNPPAATTGDILTWLQSGLPLPTPELINFFYGGPGGTQATHSDTATDAASFFAEFSLPGDPPGYINGQEITEIYSTHQAAWILP
jgi:hypothetical protein